MDKKFIAGIDLGGTNLKTGLFGPGYKLIRKDIFDTGAFSGRDSLVRAIVDATVKVLCETGVKKNSLLGLGIGVPGPVDAQKGLVHFFPNIKGWKEVYLASILRQRLGIPVFLDNDANLMCLAEHALGAAKGYKNAICLTLGTGVGGGLIINSELFRGRDNATGEIGHMPLNEKGPRCNCGGQACLEAYIGNKRILKTAREIFQREISLEEASALAKKGNRKAKILWYNIATHLGVALVGAVNLLNPEVIVIGGGVANAGGALFEKVREVLRQRAMPIQAKGIRIVKARLGSNAGLIGAAILVKENL